jgi:hypothetical protein
MSKLQKKEKSRFSHNVTSPVTYYLKCNGPLRHEAKALNAVSVRCEYLQ